MNCELELRTANWNGELELRLDKPYRTGVGKAGNWRHFPECLVMLDRQQRWEMAACPKFSE